MVSRTSRQCTINQKQYRSEIDTFTELLQRFKDSVVSTGKRNTSHGNCDDETLRLIVGGIVISKKITFQWSSLSPGISPLDFLLWRYCKVNMYHNNPQSMIEIQR